MDQAETAEDNSSESILGCLGNIQYELESLKTFKKDMETFKIDFENQWSTNNISQSGGNIALTLFKNLEQQLLNQSIITTQLQSEMNRLKTQVEELECKLRRGQCAEKTESGLPPPEMQKGDFEMSSEIKSMDSEMLAGIISSASPSPNRYSTFQSTRQSIAPFRRPNRRYSMLTSIFSPSHKTQQEEEGVYMPQDIYSFLACSNFKSKPFWVGLSVYVLQITTSCLLICNTINVGRYPLLHKLPANVNLIVRVTQFFAIIISILVHDDVLTSMDQFMQGYSEKRMGAAFPQSSKEKFWVSFFFHSTEAGLVLLASFFLIVTADDVTSLLLNFSAVAFISGLDAVAFQLASAGFFGFETLEKAIEISDTSYEKQSTVNHKQRVRMSQLTLLLIYLIMFGIWANIFYRQANGLYLCRQIYVQFADHLAAHGGLYDFYDGNVQAGQGYYLERKAPKSSGQRGGFYLCAELNTWTFSYDIDNPCNWTAKSSIPFTFDILQSTSKPWEFKDAGRSAALSFHLSCFENTDSTCIGEECLCSADMYGLECDFKDPCSILAVKELTSLVEIPTRFVLLRFVDGSAGSIQAYHRPIFITKTPTNNAFSLILFSGRRWIVSTTHDIQSPKGFNVFQTHEDVATYFNHSGFHASNLPFDSVHYMSAAVDDTVSSLTPQGLTWHYPAILSKKSDGLPMPDLSRPIDGVLFCAVCNNITNPCYFGGECNEIDGTCKCKFGAQGSLCNVPPTGNSVCNHYFNTQEHQYDHGDCCGATCSDQNTCGVSALSTAFGTHLALRGDGFPDCVDPRMVPITIRIQSTQTYYLGLSLICGETTYMQIPTYALFYDYFNGTEVMNVMDGGECELTLTMDTASLEQDNIQASYEVEVYYGKIKNNNSSSASLIKTARGIFHDSRQTVSISFTVIKSCLFRQMSEARKEMLNENNPLGNALRWLNSDKSTRSSCIDGGSFDSIRQRFALAVLKFATRDFVSNFSPGMWLSDENECNWQGISCNSDNVVTGIELMRLNLTGEIPSEIGLLSDLEELNMGYNDFSGPIPTEIGMLTNLVEFQLVKNRLTGPIPTELGNLRKLEILFLGINQFTGPIPSEIGKLFQLTYLLLGINYLTGEIPESIFNLTNLDVLALSFNELTGTISSKIANLQKLKNFMANNNQMSGEIPATIGSLVELETISLSDNKITGTIPITIGKMVHLEELMLFSNKLTGEIPTQFGHLNNLKKIALSSNSLTGFIPSELGNLIQLKRLSLQHNKLTGTMSKSFNNLSNIALIELYNNAITGNVPRKLCDLDKLELLAIDCKDMSCPADCKCRGVDVKQNLFSCLPSQRNKLECESDSIEFHLELIPDARASEIRWNLVMNEELVLSGGSEGGQTCIRKTACGIFTIKDSGGDGMCCSSTYGHGSYTLFLDGNMIAHGGRFEDTATVQFCGS